jgi:hypothetical protein
MNPLMVNGKLSNVDICLTLCYNSNMLLRAPKEYTYQHTKIKNATRKNRCPICSGTGCGLIDGGKVVLCWRESYGSIKQTVNGAWVHKTDNLDFRPTYVPPVKHLGISADTNTVYTAFLEALTLRDKHYNHLSKIRKLSDDTIKLNQFKSVPTKTESRRICAKLGRKVNLEHVPGFFFDGEWRLNVSGSGFFVPYRDVKQSIRGMQIRFDFGDMRYFWLSSKDYDTGASSGAPVHYCRPELVTDKIWVTEGGLKAICISEYASLPVIALGGVTAVNYENFFLKTRKDLPLVDKVVLAFDKDWEKNIHVRRALERITEEGRKQNYEVSWEVWKEDFKGWDDLLLWKLLHAK